MFVARRFDIAGAVTDERVLDLVVERKSVDDLQNCLIKKSKTCAPLSFFEAQMYKLQQTPGVRRVFLMEGDEDSKNGDNGISTVGNPGEWVLRRKRVKTMRNQIRGEEWQGVQLVCTTDKNHSVQYLVDRMAEFMKERTGGGGDSFDPSRLHLYRTMDEYKQIVNERMRDATFLEYLRLRKIKGTGDVTAMKTIRNPELCWDKNFVSPACIARDRKYKSNLEDRAAYYMSNNVGGMSRMGNAIMSNSHLTSSASTRTASATPAPSLRKENTNPTRQKSTLTRSKKATNNPECKKCRQELESGQKNKLRHDATCPKKRSSKRPTDSNDNSEDYDNKSKAKKYNDYASLNQYKKKAKAKPTEPIYYNPNPIRRTSLLGGSGIDDDLIASIHSTRPDLTGGSGLGVGGFELSSSRAKACNGNNIVEGSSDLGIGGLSQCSSSSSDSSTNQKPAAVCKSHSSDGFVDLDCPETAVSQATKVASRAVEAASVASVRVDNEVIVLDDSDDEGYFHRKPAANAKNNCAEVEVIEID